MRKWDKEARTQTYKHTLKEKNHSTSIDVLIQLSRTPNFLAHEHMYSTEVCAVQVPARIECPRVAAHGSS